MSLDIFGKVFARSHSIERVRNSMSALGGKSGVFIAFDVLDPEDERVIDEESGLENHSLSFAVYSQPGETHATHLWGEAQDRAVQVLGNIRVYVPSDLENIRWPSDYLEKVKETRLGRFVGGLAILPHYEGIAIALVDGGIEGIYRGRADECVERILKEFALSWDNCSNALYVLKEA